MRVLLICAAATAAAPAWLPSEPGASCLPDPYEGLDASARENAEIAATALDATTVWTLDAADAQLWYGSSPAAALAPLGAPARHTYARPRGGEPPRGAIRRPSRPIVGVCIARVCKTSVELGAAAVAVGAAAVGAADSPAQKAGEGGAP